MKKAVFFTLILTMIRFAASAQNASYQKTMEELTEKIQSTPFGVPLQPLANRMERVAAAEKNEWLPNYWVAFCYMRDSFLEKEAGRKDLLLEKAEEFLARAEQLSENNDELLVLKANIGNARLAVSPADRWQTYGPKVQTALAGARKINNDNPRISLLEGEGMFYTPENFGGGKAKAKVFFEKALEKYERFSPQSAMHPNWGKETTIWYISQCN